MILFCKEIRNVLWSKIIERFINQHHLRIYSILVSTLAVFLGRHETLANPYFVLFFAFVSYFWPWCGCWSSDLSLFNRWHTPAWVSTSQLWNEAEQFHSFLHIAKYNVFCLVFIWLKEIWLHLAFTCSRHYNERFWGTTVTCFFIHTAVISNVIVEHALRILPTKRIFHSPCVEDRNSRNPWSPLYFSQNVKTFIALIDCNDRIGQRGAERETVVENQRWLPGRNRCSCLPACVWWCVSMRLIHLLHYQQSRNYLRTSMCVYVWVMLVQQDEVHIKSSGEDRWRYTPMRSSWKGLQSKWLLSPTSWKWLEKMLLWIPLIYEKSIKAWWLQEILKHKQGEWFGLTWRNQVNHSCCLGVIFSHNPGNSGKCACFYRITSATVKMHRSHFNNATWRHFRVGGMFLRHDCRTADRAAVSHDSTRTETEQKRWERVCLLMCVCVYLRCVLC